MILNVAAKRSLPFFLSKNLDHLQFPLINAEFGWWNLQKVNFVAGKKEEVMLSPLKPMIIHQTLIEKRFLSVEKLALAFT